MTAKNGHPVKEKSKPVIPVKETPVKYTPVKPEPDFPKEPVVLQPATNSSSAKFDLDDKVKIKGCIGTVSQIHIIKNRQTLYYVNYNTSAGNPRSEWIPEGGLTPVQQESETVKTRKNFVKHQ